MTELREQVSNPVKAVGRFFGPGKIEEPSPAATADIDQAEPEPRTRRRAPLVVGMLLVGLLLAAAATAIVLWAADAESTGNSPTAALPDTAPTTTIATTSTTTTIATPERPSASGETSRNDSVTQDGMYLVGTDILPGRYVARGGGSLCYLAVTSDASGNLRSIVRTYFGDAWGRRVELEEGQFFETDACGTWQLEPTQ